MSRILFDFFDDGTLYPLPVGLTGTLPAPTVVIPSPATLTPSPVTLTISLTVGVASNSIPTPSPVVVTLSIPVPTITVSNAVLTPSPVGLTLSIVTPYATGARILTPSPLTLTISTPIFTRIHTGEQIATPNPVVATFTAADTTIALSGTATLAPLPLVAAVTPFDIFTGDAEIASDDRLVAQQFIGLLGSAGDYLTVPLSSITCTTVHEYGEPFETETTEVSEYPTIPLPDALAGTETIFDYEEERLLYRHVNLRTVTRTAEGAGYTSTMVTTSSLALAQQRATVTLVIPTNDEIIDAVLEVLDTDERVYLKVNRVDVYASGATLTSAFILPVAIDNWSRSRRPTGDQITVDGSEAQALRAPRTATYSNRELSDVSLSGVGESSSRGKSFKTPLIDTHLYIGATVESDSDEFVSYTAYSITWNLSTTSRSMTVSNRNV